MRGLLNFCGASWWGERELEEPLRPAAWHCRRVVLEAERGGLAITWSVVIPVRPPTGDRDVHQPLVRPPSEFPTAMLFGRNALSHSLSMDFRLSDHFRLQARHLLILRLKCWSVVEEKITLLLLGLVGEVGMHAVTIAVRMGFGFRLLSDLSWGGSGGRNGPGYASSAGALRTPTNWSNAWCGGQGVVSGGWAADGISGLWREASAGRATRCEEASHAGQSRSSVNIRSR